MAVDGMIYTQLTGTERVSIVEETNSYDKYYVFRAYRDQIRLANSSELSVRAPKWIEIA